MSVFAPTAGAFADGPPAERVQLALELLGGLSMADLMHLTALSWDELYAIVDAGLEARQFRGEQTRDRYSQGEKVPGGTRYFVR